MHTPPDAPSQAPLDWSDYHRVLTLARAGSLRAAATVTRQDESTHSRHLARIEAALGCALFHRDATGLTPTDAGHEVIDIASRIEAAVASHQTCSTPRVRITAVPLVVNHLLLPAVAAFSATPDAPPIDFIADQHSLHLGRQDADLAIRLARPESDHASPCRRLGTLHYRTYRHADSADNVEFIGQHDVRFDLPQHAAVAAASATLPRTVVNDGESVLRAVKLGLGRALLPVPIATQWPTLQVCTGAPTLAREVWLLTRPGTEHNPSVQAVKDWLVQTLHRALTSRPH